MKPLVSVYKSRQVVGKVCPAGRGIQQEAKQIDRDRQRNEGGKVAAYAPHNGSTLRARTRDHHQTLFNYGWPIVKMARSPISCETGGLYHFRAAAGRLPCIVVYFWYNLPADLTVFVRLGLAQAPTNTNIADNQAVGAPGPLSSRQYARLAWSSDDVDRFMARSLPKPALPHARRVSRAQAQALPGAIRVWPPLLLALLTFLTLTAVYMVRPTVRIDLGGNFDAAYLRDFHGREIDAVGAAEATGWPRAAATTTLPGERAGVWLATLRVAADQPDHALRPYAVAVNGVRVAMPRRGPRELLAAIPPHLAASEQLVFQLVPGVVGDPEPPVGLVDQVAIAPARTYRWSSGESTIALPGLGRGDWRVDLNVITAHPDGQPLDAQVFANGRLLATLPDLGEMRRVSLLVPAALLRGGDLELTLRSNTFADPRPLGIFVSDVAVRPAGAGGWGAAVPPWGTLAAALTIVLGLYACLALLVGQPAQASPGGARRAAPVNPWLAFAGALAVALLGGWALLSYRFPTSFMLPRLALLAGWSLLLLLALRPLLTWMFRAAGVPFATGRGWSLREALLLAFFVSYWIKGAGMLYPYFVGIDVSWHMDRVQWIIDGRLPLLYGVNSPLNESTMPEAEWGTNRPVIPYSPYFHMFAVLYALLPFSLSMSANMVSLLLDCSRVLLIALLARAAGLSERAALLAGGLYALLPVTFLLHSWGNVPTTFGLWWTLAATVFLVAAWDRLHERGPMVALSLLLLATFLFYTVTGVFMGFFLLIFTALAWLMARRGPEGRALHAGLRPLWTATGVAIAAALIIYYGQYIGPIIQQTLPYMQTVFTQGPESVGVVRPSFGQYMGIFIPHLDYRRWDNGHLYYGIAIPLLFLIPGFLALWKRPLIWVTLAAWFTVALLFMFAGYRISMVDKQIFYMLPAMCICWAVYAERYWDRGRWGRLFVAGIYAFTLAAAVALWVFRIVNSPVR